MTYWKKIWLFARTSAHCTISCLNGELQKHGRSREVSFFTETLKRLYGKFMAAKKCKISCKTKFDGILKYRRIVSKPKYYIRKLYPPPQPDPWYRNCPHTVFRKYFSSILDKSLGNRHLLSLDFESYNPFFGVTNGTINLVVFHPFVDNKAAFILSVLAAARCRLF